MLLPLAIYRRFNGDISRCPALLAFLSAADFAILEVIQNVLTSSEEGILMLSGTEITIMVVGLVCYAVIILGLVFFLVKRYSEGKVGQPQARLIVMAATLVVGIIVVGLTFLVTQLFT